MREKYHILCINNFVHISIILMLVGVGMLCLTSLGLSQGDTWTRKLDIPTARGALSASVVSGKIYAIAGWSTNMGQKLGTVEEYDPAMDTWATKKNIPTPRALHCTAVVNDIIYVIGGDATWRKVEAYDPATDTLTTKSNMPTGRGALSCAVVNGKIYVMGGTISPNWPYLKIVEEYEPVTDSWTPKSDMHTGRYNFASSVVDGIIYTIGGQGASNTVEAYDPATDTWTQKAGKMSTGRTNHVAYAVNGIIYVIGGLRGSSTLSKVEAYDPISDTFTEKMSMPTPRMQSGIGAVNGKIYVIGGEQTASIGDPGCKIVEEYTPPITSVENKDVNSPASFVLHQNYPNPFNPETRIKYKIAKHVHVVLKVINSFGQEVCTLVNEKKPAGFYETVWDGRDNFGQQVASGLYLYQLEAKNFIQTRKMVLLR